MKTVAIHTLGCRANQLESSIISDQFREKGWQVIDFNEKADIYIINTCTVTSKSDSTSRYFIRKAKRTNQKAKIVVVGCYSQISPDEVSKIDEVDLVLGNTEKLNIDTLLKNLNMPESKVIVADIMQEKILKDKVVHSAMGRTRANIKIQDGCNFKCSYCIISTARGKSRSKPIESVIEQINNIVNNGFNEVVLSGIHLGQWGLDFSPKDSLFNLLQEVEKIKNLKRYRISSIDPMEFDDNLVDTLINSEKFCRHLHISLQSGSNEILKKMKRRYTVEYYSDLIKKLTENIKDISIGSDIIVGFPGETEEQFSQTCDNLKALPISYIHVFSYSKRKNTPAAIMPNQVPENVKKERNAILTEIAKEKNFEFRKNLIGKPVEVLIENTRDKETGLLKGVTDNFITVLIDAEDKNKNELISVNLTKVEKDKTYGEVIK